MDMKNNERRHIVDLVLDEYVVYGGPIITRRELLSTLREQGASAKFIDFWVFGRTSVPAPVDPAAHLAMHRQTVAMGW